MIYKKRLLQKLIIALVLTACITGNGMVVSADENIQLYAKAAVLMDADSYRILYGVNENECMPMASTTKIMTLLVTLENAGLDEIVTVSDYAASMPDVQLNIRSGEQYYLKDLVYSMMLESHNDSAVAIAEHVGGSVENFAVLMNKKAEEIGCQNTWYITPNGLDAVQEKMHSTTAADLAKVMSYCVTKSRVKDEFLRITQTQSHSFSDMSGKRNFFCSNHNLLLQMMDGAISGKTGYTGKAGYCYVGAVKRDGKTFVVALLACGWPSHKNYKWKDTAKLISYGYENYQKFDMNNVSIPAEKKGSVLIINTDGTQSSVLLTEKEEKIQNCEFLKREDEEIHVEIEKVVQISAPVEKGQVLGKLKYYCGEDCLKTVSLKTTQRINRIGYWQIWNKIAERILL